MRKRRHSTQPQWVKILMQEMLKPPLFLQKIVEEEKEKTTKAANAGASNASKGAKATNTAESADSAMGKNSAGKNFAAKTRFTSKTGGPKPSDSSGFDNSANRKAAPKIRVTSSRKPSNLRGLSPRNQDTLSRNSSSQEALDAEDWIPASLPNTKAGEAHSKNWREALKKMGVAQIVTKQYGWKVDSVKPHLGIIQIRTPSQTYALKETELPPQRIEFLYDAEKYLRQHGFSRLSRFALTKRKQPFVQQNQQVYYATCWIEGRPASFANKQDVAKIASALADFHEASLGFESSRYNPPMEFDLKGMLHSRYDDLKILLSQADGKSSPGTFDKLLLAQATQLRNDAEQSLKLLDDPDCQDFLLHQEFQPGLCHLDVIPSNFLLDKTQSIHLIDLDLVTYAPRVLDISHLLRRSLQVQNWDQEVAYQCFLNFDKVHSIAREEYLLILALLQFPYRPWRLAMTRYRAFAEASQVSALKHYRNQEENRRHFLRQLEQQIQ